MTPLEYLDTNGVTPLHVVSWVNNRNRHRNAQVSGRTVGVEEARTQLAGTTPFTNDVAAALRAFLMPVVLRRYVRILQATRGRDTGKARDSSEGQTP